MEKKTTIYDVARRAGVSVATVSRVLNKYGQVKRSTSQRVIAAIEELGFVPHNSVRHGGQKSEAAVFCPKRELLLVLAIPYAENAFYSKIIIGCVNAAHYYGHQVMVSYQHINEYNVSPFLHFIRQHKAAGLVLFENIPDTILKKIQDEIPAVQCSERSSTYEKMSYVSIENEAAGYQAARYLIVSGSRRPAFFTTAFKNSYAGQRFQGYSRAMYEAGLSVSPEYIVEVADFDFNIASAAVSRLFTLPEPPDGIFAVSDVLAAASVKAAAGAGKRIPQDISIIGFDNTSIAVTTTPSITTISQPIYQLGFCALEILLQEIERPDASKRHIMLPTELIERESTSKHFSGTL